MGPTYRADVCVALEAAPHLSVAELARRTYASFATAWQAKQDFEILAGAREEEEGLTSKEPSVRCGWRRGRRSPSVTRIGFCRGGSRRQRRCGMKPASALTLPDRTVGSTVIARMIAHLGRSEDHADDRRGNTAPITCTRDNCPSSLGRQGPAPTWPQIAYVPSAAPDPSPAPSVEGSGAVSGREVGRG